MTSLPHVIPEALIEESMSSGSPTDNVNWQDRPLAAERRPRIGIIAMSVIPDDPRVRRQGDAFTKAGWDVVGFGLPGARSPAPVWPIVTSQDDLPSESHPLVLQPSPEPPPRTGVQGSLLRASARMLRLAGRAILKIEPRLPRGLRPHAMHLAESLRAQLFTLEPENSEPSYWTLNSIFHDIYHRAKAHKVDVWLANDWTSGTLAQRLAREQGVPFGYDTHELAVDEYAENVRWRRTQRPMIRALEGEVVRRAAVVTCVSSGISRRMARVHRMARAPRVIRNTPEFRPAPFRATGDTVRILYHGLVVPGRGLEACIRSLPLWRAEFTLTIRGPADPVYAESLVALAAENGVAARFTLAPPVPMVELVSSAAAYDVGIFVLPPDKLQNVYVLPNKLFEYFMAGLATCVSDTPEMAEVVRRAGAGVLIRGLEPEVIAAAVNSLTRDSIDEHRRCALRAAKSLNWNAEATRMLLAYGEAVGAVSTVKSRLIDS